MDIIKALKDTRYPFGLWHEPECYGKVLGGLMTEKAREISGPNFEWYISRGNGTWVPIDMTSRVFVHDNTYRLRPNYELPEEKPEIVEWPINPDSGGTLCYEHPIEGSIVDKITEAINQSDFIGFKYEDGKIYPVPRIYKFKDKAITYYSIDIDRLDEYEVLTPTHVLFQVTK